MDVPSPPLPNANSDVSPRAAPRGDSPPRYSVEEHLASDGYCWRYRRYTPDAAPLAHVVFIHGIQSHGGWYEYSCERLRQSGFLVSFLDRRGSGLNDLDRGDAPSFRRLLDDLAEFLGGSRVPDVPLFLAAISWGGKLAVALERRTPGLVDGLALLCPGFFPRVKPPLPERLAIAAARLVRPRKLFPIPLNDPELFTATPRWQDFIRTDPLSLRQATARFLVESVRLDFYVRQAPPSVQAPVLLLLAEHDRIIHNDRTRQFVAAFAARDQEVREYPGAHHTLEFEPDPDRYLADLRQWLERQTKRPKENHGSHGGHG